MNPLWRGALWSQEFSIGLVLANLKIVYAMFGAAEGSFVIRGRLISGKKGLCQMVRVSLVVVASHYRFGIPGFEQPRVLPGGDLPKQLSGCSSAAVEQG